MSTPPSSTRDSRFARSTSPLRNPATADLATRNRRAMLLPVLTAVVPGSAQIVAGSRRLGRNALRVLLAIWGIGIVGAVLFFVDPSIVLSVFTNTWVLLGLIAVVFALALGWAALFFDAWRLGLGGRPSPGVGVLSGIIAVALVVCTSGPLIHGARMLTAHRGLVGTVFAKGGLATPSGGRFNILLIGGDAGEGRTGLRNDTNILLSVDAETGKAVQVGIPRNLESVRFAPGSPLAAQFPKGFKSAQNDRKFNAIYKYGAEHPDLYPGAKDPGAEAVKDAATGATGLDVHYFVIVDMKGFEAVIDALGGVEVDVRKRVPKASVDGKNNIEGYIEPGRQTLTGADALWFARSRYGSDDYERMARQRCVIAAAARQLDPKTVITRYIALASASPDLITTDIPSSGLGTLGEIAMKTRGQPIEVLQLVPPLVNTGNPNYGKIHAAVADLVKNATAADGDAGENTEGAPAAGGGGAPAGGDGGQPAGGGGSAPAPQPADDSAVCSA